MTPFVPVSLIGLVLLSLSSAQTFTPAEEDLTNRNGDFAARLFRAVSSRTDDNVFLSTFTLSNGLLALLSATGGSTRDQLLQGLSLTGLDPETLPGRPVEDLRLSVFLAINCETTVSLCCSQICFRV